MSNKIRVYSPLGFLALTACGGENNSTSTGYAIKGPLSNALVFADANGNGVFDTGETSTRTDANGGYSLSNPNAYSIVVMTDDQTIDTSTGQVLSGLVMKGSANSGVITPLTGLANSGIDTRALAEVLGLDPNTDFNTFNPYADGVNSTAALAYEKASQQVVGAAQVIAATLEKTGEASSGQSLMKAFNTISEQITKAANGQASKDTLFTDAVQASSTNLSSADKEAIAKQIEAMNTEIAKVASLSGDEAKNAFGTGSTLAKIYSEDGIQAGNTTNVTQLAANAAPTDIVLGKLTISEGSSDLSLGKITVTDDAGSAQAFTYALSGADAAKFQIVNGELFLKASPDYEAKSSYDLKITVTDAGKKSYSEDIRISVKNVNELTEQVAEFGSVGVVRAGNEIGVDAGDALFALFRDADNTISGKSASSFASSTREWLSDGVVINGASGQKFVPQDAHIGTVLSVRHTLIDQQGNRSVFEQNLGTVLPDHNDIPFMIDVFADATGRLESAAGDIPEMSAVLESFSINTLQKIADWADVVANEPFELEIDSEDPNKADIRFETGYQLGFDFENLNPTSLGSLLDSLGGIEFVNPLDPATWSVASGINAISLRTDQGSLVKFEFVENGYGNSNPQDVLRIMDFTATGDEVRTLGFFGNFDTATNVLEGNVDALWNAANSEASLVSMLEILQASQDMNGLFIQTANNSANSEPNLVTLEWDRDNSTSAMGPDEMYFSVGPLSMTLVGDFGDDLPSLAKLFDAVMTTDLSNPSSVETFASAISEAGFNYLSYADFKVDNEAVLRLRINDPEGLGADLFNAIDFDGELPPVTYEHNGVNITEYVDNDGLYAFVGDGAEIDAILNDGAWSA